MHPFVAIDFETANENRFSACAVGLVKYDSDGVIIDSFSHLIQPHPSVNYFNPVNTWIHGLTAADVEGQAEWVDIFPEMKAFIADLPLVGHNMAFDGYVLRDLCQLYEVPLPSNRQFCTYRLSRRINAEVLERHRLETVYAHYFPHETFAHHHALADAQACGRIFHKMQELYGYEYLEQQCPPARVRERSHDSTEISISVDELVSRYGVSQLLHGIHICFTGTVQRAQRAALEQFVSRLGGIADKNLTRKTDILVVGIPNPRSWSEGASASRKLIKAHELRESGSAIRVLSEEEFFNQLEDDIEQ